MTGQSQGNLANLWVVGGEQTNFSNKEESRGSYRFCPECGWQLTGKFSTCPRCSVDLRLRRCTYCGRWVPFPTDPCPCCTAPLD